MNTPTTKQSKELAALLYQRTIDFVQEECYEMLYEMDMIEELDDIAIEIMNRTIENYFAHHIKTENNL